MWTASGGPNGPDEGHLRRMSAPDNELPVALPIGAVIARTADVALGLVGLRVHTTGPAFELVIRLRPSAGSAIDLHETFCERGPGGPGFLLGVEFADGRRASNLRHDGEVVLNPAGGSGGERSVDQSWWLHPLPPDGPLRFVVRCDELGVPETVTELDGAAIRRAVENVVVLWPWERPWEDRERPQRRPPDVPPGSWLAGR